VNIAVAAHPRTLADVIPMPGDRVARIAREVALVGGFAVLTAVFAQLKITLGFTPVPITGQTFAVLLAGTVLGWQRGLASQALYWAVGIVVPFAWYAEGTHGWQVAHGTTAGYLGGFVIAAAVVGYLAERGQDRSIATSIPAMLAGTAVIYVCGVLWLAYKLNVPVADGETNAIELGLTPFLVGDALKLTAAGLITPLAWQAVDRWRS
jgi:biotin transport system substrate-specific component